MHSVQQEPIQFHSSYHTIQTQDDSMKVQGRWNTQEHLKFLNAIIRYGKDWKKVEDEVATRTGAQVRSHAQKYFLKITKIIKDRKKIKGKKMPEITETQLQLKEYFANHNLTHYTPKQVIQLLKIQKVGIKNIIEQNCNGNQLTTLQQLLAPTAKLQKKKSQKVQIQNPAPQKNIFQLIQIQVNQNHEDSSFFSQFMLRNKQYFINGGQFSRLIDYGNDIKRQKGSIYQQQTSGQRKFSFTHFENENAMN